MPAKITIVEDELETSTLLKDILLKQGFKVSVFATAEDALNSIRRDVPDLLILDVGLPGRSGLQLCEVVRNDPRTSTILVLFLTSLASESQKVHGLKIGADDYVTKPFSVQELTARVQALLRRQTPKSAAPPPSTKAHGIVMDHVKHAVSYKGKAIDLRSREYALLELFMKRKGQVLTYTVIAEAVWRDDREVTSANVQWWVKELRAKLGPAGKHIETVPNLGYRFSEE